jgi:biopolymer transport protein ExbD
MIRLKRPNANRHIFGINITPFTDVCLVLLIIFMVTASALTKTEEGNLRLNLPKAVTAETPMPQSLTVRITANAEYLLNNMPVEASAVEAEMRRYHDEHQVRLLVVRADEGIPYRMVVETIDSARKVGLDQIALATRKPAAEPSAE